MSIDAHAHVFSEVSERFPRDVHELYPAERAAPAEALLAEMDACAVSHAVLVALSPHDDYIADCLRRYPDRFAGVGIQPPGDFAVDEHVARFGRTPLQGLRVFSLGDPEVADVTSLSCFPLLRQLADDGTKLWFYSSEEQLRLLGRILERLPELVVVLNHLGLSPGTLVIDAHARPSFTGGPWPPSVATALDLARYPGVYVLFSGHYAFSREAYPYLDLRWLAEALVGTFGVRRLLLGSDYPWIAEEPGYRAVMTLLDEQLPELSSDERQRVSTTNAQELFRFV